MRRCKRTWQHNASTVRMNHGQHEWSTVSIDGSTVGMNGDRPARDWQRPPVPESSARDASAPHIAEGMCGETCVMMLLRAAQDLGQSSERSVSLMSAPTHLGDLCEELAQLTTELRLCEHRRS
eukprot:833320-Rhodomonas_salina.1